MCRQGGGHRLVFGAAHNLHSRDTSDNERVLVVGASLAFVDAILNDRPYNEAEYGATSTMTAIMGRLATYSGQVVHWDDAFGSEIVLTTDAESWDAPAPINPLSDGSYRIPIPGVTKVL